MEYFVTSFTQRMLHRGFAHRILHRCFAHRILHRDFTHKILHCCFTRRILYRDFVHRISHRDFTHKILHRGIFRRWHRTKNTTEIICPVSSLYQYFAKYFVTDSITNNILIIASLSIYHTVALHQYCTTIRIYRRILQNTILFLYFFRIDKYQYTTTRNYYITNQQKFQNTFSNESTSTQTRPRFRNAILLILSS